LGFYALGDVDHDDDAVHGREGAEGVFGKVLVAWGVQDVDFIIVVIEAHHRGGHRDTALLLDFHPVGGGGLLDLVGLDGTGHVDGTPKEQEFFSKGGFAGVGVTDDGERASPGYFLFE